MLIGYARVSTDDQNLDIQRDALRLAVCAEFDAWERRFFATDFEADDDTRPGRLPKPSNAAAPTRKTHWWPKCANCGRR